MAVAVISSRISSVIVSFALSPITIIYTAAAPAAGIYNSTLVDSRIVRNLLFRITNTCDQALNVQTIGNLTNAAATAVLIGIAMPIIALTGIITVGVDLNGDDWHPYLGIQVTVPAGVTLGTLTVEAITRS